MARIEAAKAQLAVERADKADNKAEEHHKELQKELNQLHEKRHQAETKAAVAEIFLKKWGLKNSLWVGKHFEENAGKMRKFYKKTGNF